VLIFGLQDQYFILNYLSYFCFTGSFFFWNYCFLFSI